MDICIVITDPTYLEMPLQLHLLSLNACWNVALKFFPSMKYYYLAKCMGCHLSLYCDILGWRSLLLWLYLEHPHLTIVSLGGTLRRLITAAETISDCQILPQECCSPTLSSAFWMQALPFILKLLTSPKEGCALASNLSEINMKYVFLWKHLSYLSFGHVFRSCFCLKLWFWIWGGTNYRGGIGQAERRGWRKKETDCHTTKQAMEDEKEVVCLEVRFDFHNECLLFCSALLFWIFTLVLYLLTKLTSDHI